MIALFSGSGVGFERPIEEIRGGTLVEQIDQVGAAEAMNEENGLGTQIAELFGNHGLREDEIPNRCSAVNPI